MTLVFHGIHATAKDNANSIKRTGFSVEKSKSGKAGRGCYFWEYIKCKKNAQFLARKWWEYSEKRGDYSKLSCRDYTEIEVDISVEKEKVLDFINNLEIMEEFLALYPNGTHKESSTGAKLNLFINTLEKNIGFSFEVLRLNLSVPKANNIAFGNSHPALIVRVQNCIEIKSIN